MNLVDRYLRAVKENLPRAQQDDVIAELSENLRAQMEDEAEALGRPLLDTEQAAIIKRFGNPMTVAARYRGDARSVNFGRQLIGPELFPTYLKVLTVNVSITLLIIAVILLVGGGTAWSSTYGGLVPIVAQFIVVTGIFIYADRRFASDPDSWDPFTVTALDAGIQYRGLDGIASKLIGPAKPNRVPFTTSLLDFALNAIGVGFLWAVGLPVSIGVFAPGPGWANLYLPALGLFAVALIVPIITLVRPTLVAFRVATRAFFDGAITVLMLISLAMGQWLVLAPGVTPTPALTGVIDGANIGIRIGLAVAIVINGLSAGLELRRLRQLQQRGA